MATLENATASLGALELAPFDENSPIGISALVTLESEDDYRSHEATAVACMRWLIDTHPAAQPEVWPQVQDFALDWLEGAPDVDVDPRADILSRVVEDRRFFYSMYMRTAYLSARALHRLDHSDATDLRVELAGIDGMQHLYGIFRRADPKARSRALDRYRKLEGKGELEAYVAERLQN